MAKIIEQVIVIKFSRLVKDGEAIGEGIDKEVLQTLETVSQELVGKDFVVEIDEIEVARG